MRVSSRLAVNPLLTALLFCAGASAQNYTYTISTVAGSNRLNDGGPATGSLLRSPGGVAVDAAGNLYIADSLDNRVRKVTTAGIITTFAGNGLTGFSGDGGPAVDATLDNPTALAFDGAGNLYISDSGNLAIREVDTSGNISTVAGDGGSGSSGDGGPAINASLQPYAIAFDAAGNLYISDAPNFRIRKVDTTGTITTIAGTGTQGFAGDGAAATAAQIGFVVGLAVDSTGDIFISDYSNVRIREISAAGVISTVAGNGFNTGGPVTGDPTSVSIAPAALTISSAGPLYFVDALNSTIDQFNPVSNTITVIGQAAQFSFGPAGFNDGNGSPLAPLGLYATATGNVYVGDTFGGFVEEITGGAVVTVAGSGPRDGGPALSAFLNLPTGVAVDAAGDLFISDLGNGRLREVLASNGTITSVQGFGIAGLGPPQAVALDAAGNVYTATDQNVVTKTDTTGNTIFLAGTFGQSGYTGDGGPATSALLDDPTGLAVDAAGNVYIADYNNHVVRKVAADGTISTVVGSGDDTFSGDGGPAIAAGIDPYAVAVDATGNLFVADLNNYVVRVINPQGVISTYAGNGQQSFAGDRGPATSASLGFPTGVAVDAQGAVYITDFGNSIVWRVTPTGYINWIAGSGQYTPASGDGGPATAAILDPVAVTVDSTGAVYVADYSNDLIRKLIPTAVAIQSLGIVGGNNQTGSPGYPAPQLLQVQLTGSDGTGYFGAAVTFQVTSGSATLGSATVVTNGQGLASTTLTFGATAGPVVVTATVTGTAPATFNLQSVNGPVLNPGGIVGAGLSSPAVSALSPGGIFTIFGTALAPAGTNHNVGQADLVNGALPTNVAGTCVEVGGVRAPLFYISATQINAQTPAVAPGASVSVDVITACDTATAATSTVATIPVQPTTPEFFYFGRTADGNAAIAALNTANGAYIGPPGLIGGITFTGANAGDTIELFATGFGAVSPAVDPGVLAPGAASLTASSVTVQIGGVSANVLYAGVAPNFAGLYQVNVVVPSGVAVGEQALIISIDGVASPATGVLQIGN